MKVKSIKLHPFAGVQSREINFTDGLNLMLGPNEAGKSTLCNAIKHGLLTTTSLTKRKFEDKLERFLPVNGGDVIRVTLRIYEDNPEVCYEIQKTWRPGLRNGEAKVIKPGGTEITDENKVQKIIESICPVTPSTFREVMLSRQSELHQLMDRMKKHAEVQQELSDVLRQSVMEAGGISVDRFREKVKSEYEDYFSRWDREKQYPETDASGRDRGIRNPFKKGIGNVLEAWYEKEKARKHYEDIVAYEKQLDVFNSQLEELNAKLESKGRQYETFSPIKEGLQQRQVFESKLESIEERFGRIKKISREWPIYEDKIKNKAPELEELSNQLEELTKEQKRASHKAEVNVLQKRLAKLEKIGDEIKQRQKDLEEVAIVERKDVERLQEISNSIRNLRTTIRASKLNLTISATDNIEVTVSDIDGDKNTHALKPGDEIEEQKEGFVTLQTASVEVTVRSATGDLESVVKKLKKKEEDLANKFEELNVEDIQDAVSQYKLHEDYKRQLNNAKERFEDALGDDDFGHLKEQLQQAGDISGTRELNEVLQEREQIQEQRRELKNELANMGKALNEWKGEYGEIDHVFAQRAELTGKKNEIESSLENLPELPDKFDTVDSFNRYLKELATSIEDLQEQKREKREQLAELSGSAPEESSAEFKERIEDLESQFNRVKRKANSVARVYEETTQILDGLEDETYKPLVNSFTQWIGEMSDGRFMKVKQERELPEALVTTNKETLPFEILSHGTKDLTALAWKLTATEYFLKDISSLILLDDPMVDMDPERRKLAAKAIQKISNKQQVIICTCHPVYKRLMDANLIEM